MVSTQVCCTPAPPAEYEAEGSFGTIGGFQVYLNKPESATKAIIFASDIFGFELPLLKKLADKTAAAGFFSVVPDYFKGEPYVPQGTGENRHANFIPWLAAHQPDASIEVSKTIIKELKEQGIESIGCSGFCWGARLAAQLAKDESLINVVIIVHPAFTTVGNIKEIRTPVAIPLCEFDEWTPPEDAKEFKRILDAKPEIPSLVKMFMGRKHGWVCRYDVNIPFQVEGALEAQEDMLQFYAKHL